MKHLENEIGKEINFGKVEVLRIIYPSKKEKNADFYIISCGTDEYGVITFTSCSFPVREGGFYRIKGTVIKHKKFGYQVKTTFVEEIIPNEPKGLREFLKGKCIKGLGDIYADSVVNHFKMDTIRILDDEPERLMEVKGIGQKKMNQIRESWESTRAIHELMMFFRGCGLTDNFALKLYKKYGKDCVNIVKNNPYKIIDDVDGAGFKKADALAIDLGYDKTGVERISHGTRYILLNAANANGHCFLYGTELLKELCELLEIGDSNLLWEVIGQMRKDKELYVFSTEDGKDCYVYLPELYEAERSVAKDIGRILNGKRNVRINVKKEIEKIKKRAFEGGITYADSQIEAMIGALQHKFFIITGGPGTGKTTIIREIIESYEERKLKVALAAPTGRAAKRMQESTDRDAYTIHKLFQLSLSESDCDVDDLDADVLIIDETSMINVLLTAKFLGYIKNETIVIFVGDIDQLPPIGPGHILRDMIESGVVPFVRLSKIYRQEKESKIIKNAHLINEGVVPAPVSGKINPADDFCFISVNGRTQEDVNEKIRKFTMNAIDKMEEFYGYKKEDIQILCPIKKTSIGTYEFNKAMQEIINPYGEEFYRGKEERGGIRVGDKVMQVVNNYDKNVFNGDLCHVVNYDEADEEIFVVNDGVTVSYDITEVDQLQLAYAGTVHKSQGSQYPVVIMPISYSAYTLLQRNLLYTAVTRAEKLFILIGEDRAVRKAVSNTQVEIRNTNLKHFLVGIIGEIEV